MKLHGFHGDPFCRFKEWGVSTKNTHILAATWHGILNFVSNLFKDLALLLAGRICKFSHLNTYDIFHRKLSFYLKLFSGHVYGQSFIKTVRGPLVTSCLFYDT